MRQRRGALSAGLGESKEAASQVARRHSGPRSARGLGLIKDGPHPNAARLFIDFLLSREGQETLAAVGYYAPRTDVVSPLMKQVPAKIKVLPLPMMLATRYNEYFQTYGKVMGLK